MLRHNPYFTPYYMLVSPDRHLILDSLSLNAHWHNLPNLVVSLCKKYSKLGYQKLTLSQINFISPWNLESKLSKLKKKKYIMQGFLTNHNFILWGAKTWTLILGLKPHLLTRMRPKRRKCLERPHSGWTCREMVEDNGSRGLSSSDLMNVSQANFGLTWITFQEVPATKIDFKCTENG